PGLLRGRSDGGGGDAGPDPGRRGRGLLHGDVPDARPRGDAGRGGGRGEAGGEPGRGPSGGPGQHGAPPGRGRAAPGGGSGATRSAGPGGGGRRCRRGVGKPPRLGTPARVRKNRAVERSWSGEET